MVLIADSFLFADDEIDEVRQNIPEMLGSSNWGKDFWFSYPPAPESQIEDVMYLYLYILSYTKTKVSIDIPKWKETKTSIVEPGALIKISISPIFAEPEGHAYYGRMKVETVYKNVGLHIKSDDPIVVYAVSQSGYMSEGFLVLPTNSLGREYISASYPDWGFQPSSTKYSFPSLITITAAFDNTSVKFTMGGTANSRTAGGMKPGQTTEIFMNKGDVWLCGTAAANMDLTGSKIISNKPIAVVSGNHCANVPISNGWCNYIAEMDIPTYAWGKNYFTGKIPDRKFSGMVRIFAKEPETVIYRDGNQISFITEAGGTLGKGWLEMRLTDGDNASALISGDKPINVVFYNTGAVEDSSISKDNDPFQMNILPLESYQKEIMFTMPTKGYYGSDFQNYINLLHETDAAGHLTEDIEITKLDTGGYDWTPVNVLFPGNGEAWDFFIKGRKYALKTLQLNAGVYKIRADKPFACNSYGKSLYSTYGYLTGGVFPDKTTGDKQPPLPIWNVDSTGSVISATVTDKPDTDSVRANLSDIILIPEYSYNYRLNYDEIVPGETVTTNWNMHVKDNSKDAKAYVLFADKAGNDTLIKVEYFPPDIEIIPDKIDFGMIFIGNTIETTFGIKNNSEDITYIIESITLKHNYSNFIMGNNIQDYELDPGSILTLHILFNADSIGIFIDTLLVKIKEDIIFKVELKAEVYDPSNSVEPIIDTDFFEISPNPVTDSELNVNLYLTKEEHTIIKITNADGSVSETVYSATLQSGSHFVPIELSKYPSGVYFIEAVSGIYRQTKKIILIK